MKALLFLILLFSQFTWAQSPSLDDKVFSDEQNTDVTLVINGKKLSDTWVTESQDKQRVFFPAPPVLVALANVLSQENLKSLEGKMLPNGMFSKNILESMGINVIFNKDRSELLITAKSSAPIHNESELNRLSTLEKLKTPLPNTQEKTLSPPSPKTISENEKSSAKKMKEKNTVSKKPNNRSTDPSTNYSNESELNGLAIIDSESVSSPTQSNAKKSSSPKHDSTGKQNNTPILTPNEKPSNNKLTEDKAIPENKDLSLKPNPRQIMTLNKTREELYREIFHKEAPKLPDSIEVTLIVDGKRGEKIWIHPPKNNTEFYFSAPPIVKVLENIILPEAMKKLTKDLNGSNLLNAKIMEENGMPTHLDMIRFELSITIPSQLLGTQIHYISNFEIDPYSVNAIKPNPFSAYINLSGKEQLRYLQNIETKKDSGNIGKTITNSGNEKPRRPFVANFDGAANYKGVVLETTGDINEENESGKILTHIQDSRFVYDQPKSAMRYYLGDLLFPTVGYQTFIPSGGIGMSKDFSLQPNAIAYPVRDYEFYLENPAEVNVLINNVLVATLQLEAGTQNIKGFPFVTGESEVEIIITDITGKRQHLFFSFIHESSLLAPGKSLFSYNAGFINRLDELVNVQKELVTTNSYDFQKPFLSIYYLRGINSVFTTGIYSQAVLNQGLFGWQGLRALSFGKVQCDMALSYQDTLNLDMATKLTYSYIPKYSDKKTSRLNWRAEIEYLGRNFSKPNSSLMKNNAVNLFTSFTAPLEFVNISFGGGYSFNRDTVNSYNLSLSLAKSWWKGLSSILNFKNSFPFQNQPNTIITALVQYNFSKGPYSASANQRIESHRDRDLNQASGKKWDNYTDLNFDYNSSAPFPENPSASFFTNFGPEQNEYNGRLGLRYEQGLGDIFVRRIEPSNTGEVTFAQNYADFTFQTALVYTNKKLAFSRPVRNSFVMVNGIESHKNTDILVNPNNSGYDAKSGILGPGVLSTLAPYTLKKIHLLPVNPPIGSNSGEGDYVLFPTYKSGFSLQMGSEATIIVIGNLLDKKEKPLAYLAFKVVSLDSKNPVSYPTFTNAVGRFQIPQGKPGKYSLVFDEDSPWQNTVIEIPKTPEAFYQMGNVQIPHK